MNKFIAQKTFFALIFVFCYSALRAEYAFSDNDVSKKLEYAAHLKKSIYDVVDKKGLSEQGRLDKIIPFLMKEIDIDFLAKNALGRSFSEMNKDLQSKYVECYKDFLAKSLMINAKEAFLIPSKNVKLLKKTEGVGRDCNVFFRIEPEHEDPYDLVIRIGSKEGDKTLKVRDISVENISILESHRVLFTTEIENNGINSIFPLMENLYVKKSIN